MSMSCAAGGAHYTSRTSGADPVLAEARIVVGTRVAEKDIGGVSRSKINVTNSHHLAGP